MSKFKLLKGEILNVNFDNFQQQKVQRVHQIRNIWYIIRFTNEKYGNNQPIKDLVYKYANIYE